MSKSAGSYSDLLRDQLDYVHDISSANFERDSLLDGLQNKVHELTIYKEKYLDLEAQLKMAKEQIKLQEAEFAFQKSEYENQIRNLYNGNADMRAKLTMLEKEIENKTYTHEVQIKLEENGQRIEKLTQKYQKWKTKSKELQAKYKLSSNQAESDKAEKEKLAKELAKINEDTQIQSNLNIQKSIAHEKEIEDLKKKLSNSEHSLEYQMKTNDELSRNITSLKASMDEQKQKFQASIAQEQKKQEEFQNKCTQINKEKEDLAVQCAKVEDHNKKLQEYVDEIANQNSQAVIDELYEKNEKLMNRYQTLKQALTQSKNIIEHVELEREYLSDLLSVEPDALDERWQTFRDKIQELLECDREKINLQQQNIKLKKRLEVALEEIKVKRAAEKRAAALAEEKKKTSILEEQTQLMSTTLESKEALLSRYRIRLALSSMIEKQTNSIGRDISDLHSSLSGHLVAVFRPVILCVVFARRFFNLPKIDRPTDISALQVFGSTSKMSSIDKIREIREKFTSMTNQLLNSKQAIFDTTEKLTKTSNDYDALKTAYNNERTEYKKMAEKTEAMEKRFAELQKELATLVTKDEYTAALSRSKDLVKENEELKDNVEKLNALVNEKGIAEQESADHLAELEIEIAQRDTVIEQYASSNEEKEKHMAELNALLREKTKEILALERIVQRYRQNETSAAATYTALAVENQHLHAKMAEDRGIKIPEPPQSPVSDMSFSASINPAFLGQ